VLVCNWEVADSFGIILNQKRPIEGALAKSTKIEYEGKMVPAEELDFEADKEPWAVYKLEDGSVLRFKQALAKVCKLSGVFKPDGDPIYVFQMGGITHIEIPEELKQKKGG
jgi:hypothetical protein